MLSIQSVGIVDGSQLSINKIVVLNTGFVLSMLLRRALRTCANFTAASLGGLITRCNFKSADITRAFRRFAK